MGLLEQAEEKQRQEREKYEQYARAHIESQQKEFSREQRAIHLFRVEIPRLEGELHKAREESRACGYVKCLDFGD